MRAPEVPPRVSVAIPTKDGGARLLAVVVALLAQDLPEPFEIVLVDSGSRDGTLEALGSAPVRILRVPPASFDHGRTRNFAIAHCQGSLVALLAQDARPAHRGWLRSLVAALDADPRAAGAYSRQIPLATHPAYVRQAISAWWAGQDAPRVQATTRAELDALDPVGRQAAVIFDNVASMVRREVWRRHPFPAAPFGEDLEWALAVMVDGWRIRYVPGSRVEHSHDRGGLYEVRRTYLCHKTLHRLFGMMLVPDRAVLLRAIPATIRANLRAVREDRVRGMPVRGHRRRAVACAIGSVLGQYLGPRARPAWDRWLAHGV